MYHAISRLFAQFETFRTAGGHHSVTRFGQGQQSNRRKSLLYVYPMSKAHQLSLTGLG